MFVQILSTSTIRNVWRTVRRICILILGLKGVKIHPPYSYILLMGETEVACERNDSWKYVCVRRLDEKGLPPFFFWLFMFFGNEYYFVKIIKRTK